MCLQSQDVLSNELHVGFDPWLSTGKFGSLCNAITLCAGEVSHSWRSENFKCHMEQIISDTLRSMIHHALMS